MGSINLIIANILMVIIIILIVYSLFFVFPEEREIYEKCEIKVFCELNKINHPICNQYRKELENIPVNITV